MLPLQPVLLCRLLGLRIVDRLILRQICFSTRPPASRRLAVMTLKKRKKKTRNRNEKPPVIYQPSSDTNGASGKLFPSATGSPGPASLCFSTRGFQIRFSEGPGSLWPQKFSPAVPPALQEHPTLLFFT